VPLPALVHVEFVYKPTASAHVLLKFNAPSSGLLLDHYSTIAVVFIHMPAGA
jgi:hypothetical protein